MRSISVAALVAVLWAASQAPAVEAGRLSGTAQPMQSADQPPKTFTNTIGQTFVYIPPGTFMMGSPPDERGRAADETQHLVTLTRGFYIQTTEVTQYQWQTVMGSNQANFQDCGPLCPVESVSWHDAQKFITQLNQRPGTHRYRLPTEAEWEYAARAGATGLFAADSVGAVAWYRDNAGAKTHPVGMKAPNARGLHDMHGNVSEWVQDWYGNYPAGDAADPTGPANGHFRVNRGGAWDMPAFGCRAAQRMINGPGSIASTLGFRLVADQPR